MSQNTQQDSRSIAEAVDLPEISVEHSTEFLTGSAPCAGVSRPLPAAWLGQRGIYRSRFEAVCNGEQLVEPLTLGELIQRAWPSPSTELAERGTQHRFSTTEQTCRHDFAGVWWNDNGETKTGRECRHCGFFVADVIKAQAEQAEAERPPQPERYTADVFHPERPYYMAQTSVVRASDFDEFATQYERIVGALRFERQQMDRAFTACINERDAALARCAELKAELAMANDAAAKGDAARHQCAGMEMEIKELRGAADHWEAESRALQKQRDAALARVAKLEHSQSFQRDIDYSVLSEYADKHRLHFNNLCAVVRSALIALPAQAQHSVPEGFRELLEMLVASDLRKIRYAGAWRREVHDRASSILALLAAAPGKEVPQAWLDVQAERRRQVEAEGWTPEHDDEHDTGALASAAGCYAMFSLAYPAGDPSHFWPWDKSWWKPSPDGRRNMVKAGALILAEIERLDRAAATQGGPSDA